MRLAYYQQHSEWGSAEEYFQILIEGIKQVRPEWELFLLCPKQTRDKWYELVGFAAEVMPAEASFLGLLRQLIQLRPDLVHLNGPAVKLLAATRLARTPRIVMTFHSPSADIRYNWKGTLLWEFARRERNLHLIALTETNRKLLVEKHRFSEEKLSVIPHGLRQEKFALQFDSNEVRKELKIPPEAFVLICVARLSSEKAHEVLLDAVRGVVRTSMKPVYLLLAGEGDRRLWLEGYVEKLGLNGSIQFLGQRSDVPRLLSAADVFVLSSDFEGLPFAILEAMAVGKPVIATQVVGSKDLVSDNTGILVPPRDPQALAKAILWALNHPTELLEKGQEGRKRFLEKYTSGKVIERTLELYERLCETQTIALEGKLVS